MLFNKIKNIILIAFIVLLNKPMFASNGSTYPLKYMDKKQTETSARNKPAEKPSKEDTVVVPNRSKRDVYFFPDTDFEKNQLLIVTLTIVIIYSLLSMLVVLVIVLLNREIRDRNTIRINTLKEDYQEMLISYLNADKDFKEVNNKVLKVASSYLNRFILINQMIDLSIHLKGEEAEKLKNLYFELGLNEDSLRKLKSYTWEVKIKGFRECAFMGIQEAKPFIDKGLHSRNPIVRSEAQIALVMFNRTNPYAFLDNLKRPFTLWEQHVVHNEIIYHELCIPQFERWINSENESVALFALKMLARFEQQHSWKKVADLLHSENEIIRAVAIETLGILKVQKTQLILKKHFENENLKNKILIAKALSEFNSEKNIAFFKHVIEAENDVWLQVEAAKGIRELGEKGENELNSLLFNEDYRNYKIILKHVLDKRL